MKKQAEITDDEMKKIDKWIAKQERLQEFVPFVGIRDTWKVGRRHLHLEPNSRRMHVSASDLEARAMTYLRYTFKNPTFKTQFPLLPLEKTIQIANELEVMHPRDWKSNAAKTMSTDIVMTGTDRKTGKDREIAVFVRYLEGLYCLEEEDPQPIAREWQKIKIAELYHVEHLRQEFVILTDQELSKDAEFSINWLRYNNPEDYEEDEVILFVTTFLKLYEKAKFSILYDLLEETALVLDLSSNACLSLFRFCGTNHYLPLDINQRISLSTPISCRSIP